MTQTSLVLSQRTWPGVGDLDDCWVLSSLQCVLAVAPWEHLPGSNVYRHAAGDPDDGKTDGGTIAEQLKAIRALYPYLGDELVPMRGIVPNELRQRVGAGWVVSVALTLGKLPPSIQYGSRSVPHQCTVAPRGDGIVFANPLAPMGSKWDDVTWPQIMPAITDYGSGKVFGVAYPPASSLVTHAPGYAAALKAALAQGCGPAITAARTEGRASMRLEAIAATTALKP